jgi:hypothetical protein
LVGESCPGSSFCVTIPDGSCWSKVVGFDIQMAWAKHIWPFANRNFVILLA